MNIYNYNKKKCEWQLILLTESTNIGIDQRGELIIGATVKTNLAYLMHYKDTNGKLRSVIMPYPGTNWKLNGMRPFSLHVLQDRDELSFNGQKLYFTYEQPAQVVTFEARKGDPPIFCPRCKDIVSGKAVKCPGSCGLWYHQSEERRCWTYDPKCIVCGHPTCAGLSWKPAPVPQKVKWRKRRHENQK